MTAVQTSGFEVSSTPDGVLEIRLERVSVRRSRLHLGGQSLDVGELECAGVAVRAARPTGGAAQLRGLAVQRITLRDATVQATQFRTLPRREPWRLEPLAELDGWLEAFVTDAAWVLDAEVRVPVRHGRIDLNEVSVSHIGPDSSMGVSHMGVYVDAPNGRTYLYVFEGSHVPGARFERRGALFASRVADRGGLDLQPFVEALLAGVATGRAPHHVGPALDRTRLSGELRLDDGTISTAKYQLTLTGRSQGKNRVALSAAALSQQLVLRVSDLSAVRGGFELMGRTGTVGAVSGSLSVRAVGRRGPAAREPHRPAVMLAMTDMTLEGLAWGDIGEP